MNRALWLLLLIPTLAFCEDASPTALEFTKWSGDLNVPDPVAIAFDDHGRAYVTQTQRRKAQDLDIRANRDWVPSDVGFQSVQDKIDFYHRELAPGDDEENARHVTDMNEDDKYDYRDLMVLSEKIHLLEDTDADGVADSTQLFAEDFRTEVTGIAAGVLHHAGNVYATIAPDVWVMPDADHRNPNSSARRRLATGFGLHIAYAGHDMHGLTLGPDGKIYWSIGDKGISATSREGRKFHFPNQGGVMRCNPDGSDFEVFAHGLRNVQELAFDQWGNLFGVDNDADKPGESERFVYIVKGMDAGWRCNYQYRGKDYDPWVAERLWQPWHEGQPAYIVPPISHSIDGPAGFAFNPGTALSPEYKDFFFLTGAPNGNQIAFQVEAAGASFKMIREHRVGSGLPLVGINFGPDGALYAVDWGGGYPLNQSGAVWKLDDPRHANSPERLEVKRLLTESFNEFETPRLLELLAHADQRIRLRAQFALVWRESLPQLAETAREADSMLARVHAVWGLGQLARAGKRPAIRALHDLLVLDDEPEISAQVLRVLGDIPNLETNMLDPFLDHASPRVRFMAASALGDHGNDEVTTFRKLRRLAANTPKSDTYMRFAVARALASCLSADQLRACKEENDELQQLAAVVALRLQASPKLADFLTGTVDTVATEAALAIHDDFSVPVAMPQLAAALTESTCQTEAFVRRAINANFRIGTKETADRLATYANDRDYPREFRLEALDSLAAWKNPHPLDRVTGRARSWPISERVIGDQVGEVLTDLLSDANSQTKVAALSAVSSLQIAVDNKPLAEFAQDESADVNVRLEAVRLLLSQRYEKMDELTRTLLESVEPLIRIRGRDLLADSDPTAAFQQIARVLQPDGNATTVEQQAAAEQLGRIKTPASVALLGRLVELAKSSDAAVTKIQLELLEAAREPKTETFTECLDGGNMARGREVFLTHLSAQCSRCHRIGQRGSDVGPPLDGIASRKDPAYLLRAIVSPSADIDAKYQLQTVLLESGQTEQGVLISQNDHVLILKDAEGKEIKIATDDIEETFAQEKSLMPDMRTVLSRREIRDLVAFLRSLK